MTADLLARMVWGRHCDGRTAAEIDPFLLLVDGSWQARHVSLHGFHPAEVIEVLSPLSDDVQLLAVVTAGSFERYEPSTFERLEDGHIRMVAVVGRDGSAYTLGCVDGHDGPEVLSARCGGVYAAMVAAFVPAGELDRELDLILAAS